MSSGNKPANKGSSRLRYYLSMLLVCSMLGCVVIWFAAGSSEGSVLLVMKPSEESSSHPTGTTTTESNERLNSESSDFTMHHDHFEEQHAINEIDDHHNKKDDRIRIRVVSAVTTSANVSVLSWKLRRQFSRQHHYSSYLFRVPKQNVDEPVTDYRVKSEALEKVYNSHWNQTSLIMWMDSDALIMHCRTSIELMFNRSVRWFRKNVIPKHIYDDHINENDGGNVEESSSPFNWSSVTPDLLTTAIKGQFASDSVFILRASNWTFQFIKDWRVLSSIWESVRKESEWKGFPMNAVLSGIRPIHLAKNQFLNVSLESIEFEKMNSSDQIRYLVHLRGVPNMMHRFYNEWQIQFNSTEDHRRMDAIELWLKMLNDDHKKHVAFVQSGFLVRGPSDYEKGAWILHPKGLEYECKRQFVQVNGRHSTCYVESKRRQRERKALILPPIPHHSLMKIHQRLNFSGKVHLMSAFVQSDVDSSKNKSIDNNDPILNGHRLSNEIKRMYCKKYNYNFHFMNDMNQLNDGNEYGDWLKPRWIQQVYSKYHTTDENVLFAWFDSDALIMHCEHSLEEIYSIGSYYFSTLLMNNNRRIQPDVIISGDPIQFVNSGVILFRSSQWTLRFLENFYLISSLWRRYRSGGLKDQVALNLLLTGVDSDYLLSDNDNDGDHTSISRSQFYSMDLNKRLNILINSSQTQRKIVDAYHDRMHDRHPTKIWSDVFHTWNESFSEDMRRHVALVQSAVMNQRLRDWWGHEFVLHPFGSTCKDVFLTPLSHHSTCHDSNGISADEHFPPLWQDFKEQKKKNKQQRNNDDDRKVRGRMKEDPNQPSIIIKRNKNKNKRNKNDNKKGMDNREERRKRRTKIPIERIRRRERLRKAVRDRRSRIILRNDTDVD